MSTSLMKKDPWLQSLLHKFGRWILILILILGGIRLALPEIVKWKANRILATLPNYTGHIDGVHLAIWRGGLVLKDIEIKHRDESFGLTIQEFDAHTVWSSLFKGAWVADLNVVSPRVRMLVSRPTQAAAQVKDHAVDAKETIEKKSGQALPDLLASLIPFRIREFRLTDGSARLQENGQDLNALQEKDKDIDKDELKAHQKEKFRETRITHIEMQVRNLTNRSHLSDSLIADGHLTAKVMNSGRVKLALNLNPTAKTPTFNTNLSIQNIQLVELNPLFHWQWGVDAHQGTFSMTMEAAAGEGRFKGYVKPFLQDVKMHAKEQDKNKGIGKKIKEAVVDVIAKALRNEESEKVATRIPFEGAFESPQPGLWEAVFTVLRNAFIQALSPHLEHSINPPGKP